MTFSNSLLSLSLSLAIRWYLFSLTLACICHIIIVEGEPFPSRLEIHFLAFLKNGADAVVDVVKFCNVFVVV